MCFIVGGCDKPKIETRDCNKLGYTDKSCDGVREIVYDTCVSKGDKYVKCTCNPNYYMLTEKPTNEAAYDIEECTKVDGKKLYRATCKSDYKYTLSTIKREDGKTNSSVCGAGKTPVADGGICTMLYGDNVNKVLYKDCDCDSTYQYDKQKENGVVVEGFKYEGECKYTYGTKAGETWYSSVTCDKSKDYISTNCSGNMKEDKKVVHSGANLTCRTCKAPECPICKSEKACYDQYFDILVLHPLTGDIVLNTTFDVDSDGCWYPKFQSCTDIGLKQDEPYRDYPSTEIPEIINGVVNTTKCIADCEVWPIFGYNTEEQCKENLPSSKTCKQVTYTNKSDAGGNIFTNLGSKSLTCFVKQCKYSTQDSCKSAYSSYFSYHPISNKKINLLKDCAKDTYGCWNPVFNECEDMGMTKVKGYADLITYPWFETPVEQCMVTCKDWYKGFSNAGTYEECIQAKEAGQKCVSRGKVGTTECYYSRNVGCTDFFGTGCTEKRDLAIATCEDNVDRCLMNCSGNNCCCTAENDGYCEPRSSYCAGMVGYTCDLQDVVRYYEGQKITMTCDLEVYPGQKPNIPSDTCSGMTYAQTQSYCTKNGYSTNMGHQQNCKDGLYDFCPCNQAYTKCRY